MSGDDYDMQSQSGCVHDRDSTAAYFALFFDDPLLQHITDQTNLYARLDPYSRVNYQWQDTNVDKFRTFLGILIVTGLVSLPSLQDYWKTDTIFSQPGIAKGMSRNRFDQLCGRLHFNDNSLAPAHEPQGMISFTKLGQLAMHQM